MATPNRPGAMKKPPRSSRIREEILREWRGAEEPADLTAGIHLAQKFVAAILRAAGAEDGLHEDQVRATWKELAGGGSAACVAAGEKSVPQSTCGERLIGVSVFMVLDGWMVNPRRFPGGGKSCDRRARPAPNHRRDFQG